MKAEFLRCPKQTAIFLMTLSIFVFTGQNTNAQGVSVSATGGPPDPSAMLDVSSISRGALMPRMTTAQRDAIVSPAIGLTIFNTDCKVYNYNAGTPDSPSWATMTASNVLVAGVSITANPVGAVCSGTGVTFTATPAAGITSPTYQWQVNGANAGTNSTTYTSSALNNGDVVTCILSSGQACVTGSPATSNAITMTINSGPATPGPISGDTSLCAAGTGIVYSISPVATATSYNWSVPADASISVGSGTTSITVSFGFDTGSISVAAVNGCGVSSPSTQFIDILALPTTANAGPNQTVAIHGTATLAANTPSTGTGVWSIISGSGGNITNTASPTSTFTGSLGTYDLRWTISSPSCGSSSSDVTITFQLPAGCAMASDNTVWCTTTDPNVTGADLCGYAAGYAGTYYAITNAGAAALGMTVYGYVDCASNYVTGAWGYPNEIAGYTGPPDCYSLQDSWGRYEANTGTGDWPVVRCTSYE